MDRVDYLVVGSGGAGLYTALLASAAGSVAILTKARIEQSNTWQAQGGIAAPLDASDSAARHAEDTLVAGAGLCDPTAVQALTVEAVGAIDHLVRLGMPFDVLDGALALGMEGAHQVPRIVHAGGDATGANLERTLIDRVRDAGILTWEHCQVDRIVVEDGRAVGVEAVDLATGRRFFQAAEWIVLATGGAGQMYKYTTNPPVATGDGLALAFEAGARLADLEFFQFHPTALHLAGAPTFLISEAVRGDGGYLVNDRGKRFMLAQDGRAELAPRDIVARAIVREMEARGLASVWLDVRHLPADRVKVRFPTIYQACLGHGLDITRDLIPVAPAAHYYMGGIRTNAWGETSIPHLLAAGECACTGVHGANRLASNSLLELLVFARRIVRRTSGEAAPDEVGATAHPDELIHFSLPRPTDGAIPTLEEVQALMWHHAGITRDAAGLAEAAGHLDAWLAALGCRSAGRRELYNVILVSRLLVEAARRREESRGGHFREDFPQADAAWEKHIVCVKESES